MAEQERSVNAFPIGDWWRAWSDMANAWGMGGDVQYSEPASAPKSNLVIPYSYGGLAPVDTESNLRPQGERNRFDIYGRFGSKQGDIEGTMQGYIPPSNLSPYSSVFEQDNMGGSYTEKYPQNQVPEKEVPSIENQHILDTIDLASKSRVPIRQEKSFLGGENVPELGFIRPPENMAQQSQRYSDSLLENQKEIQGAMQRMEDLYDFRSKFMKEKDPGREYSEEYASVGGPVVRYIAHRKPGENITESELEAKSWTAPGYKTNVSTGETGKHEVFTPGLDKWKAQQNPNLPAHSWDRPATILKDENGNPMPVYSPWKSNAKLMRPTAAQKLQDTLTEYEGTHNLQESHARPLRGVLEKPSQFKKPSMSPLEEVIAWENKKNNITPKVSPPNTAPSIRSSGEQKRLDSEISKVNKAAAQQQAIYSKQLEAIKAKKEKKDKPQVQ